MEKERLFNQGYREGLFVRALSTGVQDAFDGGYHHGVIEAFNDVSACNYVIEVIEDQNQSCSPATFLCKK